ncbi:MAG: hypothetical protein HC836_02315 [Richelia sp. RM2_1_2]|nr:hypothetical protein [Richelia sp. SM2_1_7]NJN09643.1 hypothetical protein [Richelia sp. RM1_1_1]NJO27953.1 hypothetical protein [Richelia sp. SL_2_1]NJO57249.1 hypothetical protein [Richelia sp. RM2_1_2]NJS17165.1 hypothetical protein [Nostocaceae cyanobacterium CSU_2_110]
MFIPKMRFLIGSIGFLLAGNLSSYAYDQSPSQQLIQKNSPVHPQQQNLLNSSLKLTPNFSFLPTSCNSNNAAPCQNQPLSNTNTLYQPQLLSQAYKVIDELQKYQFSINGDKLFSSAQLSGNKINFNQRDLLATLINTRKYYQDHANNDPNILRPGVLETQNVSVEDITKTLDFMITILQEDIANNRTTRLQDPNFINSNFRVIKWSAYNPKEPQRKNLRITKYAVFVHPGSRKKTAKFNIPLYSLKDNANTDEFYTKYTKQDVLSGIYEPGGKEFGKVEPIVYMTREGLEEALMQGTMLVDLGGGSSAYFNVDRSNKIPYVKGLNRRSQKRYWYFREVKDIKGYGYKIDQKISIKPGVTFAGDVLNIGLGRMIVMEYMQNGRKQLRMGVIADTGGAFLPNFYQLDFLAGIFPNQNSFNQYIKQLPEYATAYILIKK